jgi:long-chain fatty acid transport protein
MGVAATGSAYATNGYFSHGYGTASKGLAGGGIALPQDAVAAANNPAGMVFVGDQTNVALALFSPLRQYTASGAPSGFPGTFPIMPGTVKSDANLFVVPTFGKNWMLDDSHSVGLTIYGNGGMNTTYKANKTPFGLGTFYGGTARVDYMQLFINGSYAAKFSDTGSWGASLIVAGQRFEARGVGAFAPFSVDPAHLTNNGYNMSWGLGAKFGVQGDVAPGLTLAASYQTKIKMGKLKDYTGFWADNAKADIPATATIGLAYKPDNKSAITLDVQHIWFSDIPMLGNPFSNLTTGCFFGVASQCLGGKNGAGGGWNDVTAVKLGYQWETANDWTWRVGYSHAKQPIPSSEVLFNILFPAVSENHITFGFTKKLDNKRAFSMSFMYSPSSSVSGPNPLEAPGAQTIKLKMHQYDIEAGWTF